MDKEVEDMGFALPPLAEAIGENAGSGLTWLRPLLVSCWKMRGVIP